ncbi:hypothetical protein J6590_089596 [Homalodisca vitripennis]|nr:hypothetical protein J6590_089596 [Homalodisca vitripennis]
MIQMAEARGLFGRPDNTPKVKTTGQTARAKAALAALQARSEMMEDKNRAKVKVEMDRIAAPTRASLLRDIRPPSTRDCPRYTHHLAHDGTPSVGFTPRLWWRELSFYLLTLLGNPDIPLPPLRLTRRKHKPIVVKAKRPRDTFPVHVNSIEFKSDTDEFAPYISLPTSSHNSAVPSVAS